MSYFALIFFLVLNFVSAVFNSQNIFFAPQRTAGDAKSFTTSFAHFASRSFGTLRTLRPNCPNSPISKISYTSAGGKAGNYESLDITPDSLVYVQGHRGVEKTISEKTLNSFWNKLTKSINLRDFDKIRSDPGHALYDGIDVTITIEKGKQKHSIVNGNEDSVNYVKIKPFTDLLENKLAEIRKKIVWQK